MLRIPRRGSMSDPIRSIRPTVSLGVVAVLGVSVITIALTTPSSATAAKKGTGYSQCQWEGTVTFSPPWKNGATGEVTASVNLSAYPKPQPCIGGTPVPTSLTATGDLTFPNGTCSPTYQKFGTRHTLTVQYDVPKVRSSKFSFTSGSGINSGGLAGSGYGTVTGSYPIKTGPLFPFTGTPFRQKTGSCTTGITEMSWGPTTNGYTLLSFAV